MAHVRMICFEPVFFWLNLQQDSEMECMEANNCQYHCSPIFSSNFGVRETNPVAGIWHAYVQYSTVQCSAVASRPVLYRTVHTIMQSYNHTYNKYNRYYARVFAYIIIGRPLSMYSMYLIFIFYVYGSSLHRGLLWQDDEDDGKKKNDMSFPRLGVSAIDRWEFAPKNGYHIWTYLVGWEIQFNTDGVFLVHLVYFW